MILCGRRAPPTQALNKKDGQIGEKIGIVFYHPYMILSFRAFTTIIISYLNASKIWIIMKNLSPPTQIRGAKRGVEFVWAARAAHTNLATKKNKHHKVKENKLKLSVYTYIRILRILYI